ncbi:hypothetical protein CB1_000996004, partial [Camelus ferus]
MAVLLKPRITAQPQGQGPGPIYGVSLTVLQVLGVVWQWKQFQEGEKALGGGHTRKDVGDDVRDGDLQRGWEFVITLATPTDNGAIVKFGNPALMPGADAEMFSTKCSQILSSKFVTAPHTPVTSTTSKWLCVGHHADPEAPLSQ